MPHGRLTDASITAVREAAAIETVISQYVTLKRAGAGSLKGTPNRGVCHCFGCQEGGDAIAFIQKIEGIGFIDAVERLADAFRVDLHYDTAAGAPSAEDRQASRQAKARLLAANNAAADWFEANLALPAASHAQAFLTERGFTAADAAQFRVGYAPDGWDHLISHLHGTGFQTSELRDAGLISDTKRGVIDRFRNRLIFPIHDINGDLIGFGARKLADGDDSPKYLNTAETVLYKKSRVLFGLHAARKAIAQQGRVVVVEGYTDVMACHLSGETTAIATCGTAFGEDHVRIVRRVLGDDNATGEVIYAFDGDAAGQKAALRAFALDDHFQTRTSVVVAPDGQDPCEIRMHHGPEGVRALFEQRTPLVEFAIKTTLGRFDLTTYEGRSNAVREVAPLLAGIRHDDLRTQYVRDLSRRTGIDYDDIRGIVLAAAQTPTQGKPQPQAPEQSPGERFSPDEHTLGDTASLSTLPSSPAADLTVASTANTAVAHDPAAEAASSGDPFSTPPPDWQPNARESLKMMLQNPRVMAEAVRLIDRADFAHPAHKALYDTLVATSTLIDTTTVDTETGTWLRAVQDTCHSQHSSPTLASLVVALAVEEVRTRVGATPRAAQDAFAALAIEGATRVLDYIELTVANPDATPEQIDTALAHYQPTRDRLDQARASLAHTEGSHL